jgi:hypothetical protein
MEVTRFGAAALLPPPSLEMFDPMCPRFLFVDTTKVSTKAIILTHTSEYTRLASDAYRYWLGGTDCLAVREVVAICGLKSGDRSLNRQ